MIVAHALSCLLDRQQEYDADRRATRLIGSEEYASILRQLAPLDLAAGFVTSNLADAQRSSRLCDDYPALVRFHAESFPDELRQAIRSASEGSGTGWFDTHPSTRDRIAQVGRENSAGVYRCPLAAAMLFRDFATFAKARTLDYYREVLGTTVPRKSLVSIEQWLSNAG